VKQSQHDFRFLHRPRQYVCLINDQDVNLFTRESANSQVLLFKITTVHDMSSIASSAQNAG